MTNNEKKTTEPPPQPMPKRMLDLNGGQKAPVCLAFGIAAPTLENWLKVFELAPTVRKAIDAGEISMTAAATLHQLPREEQEKALAEAKAPSSSPRRITARKVAEAAGVDKPRMKSRRKIEKRLAEPRLPPDYKTALRWVLGLE